MSHTYRVLTPHLAGLTSLKLTAAATITTDITTETLQGMPKRKGQCARLGLLGGGGFRPCMPPRCQDSVASQNPYQQCILSTYYLPDTVIGTRTCNSI